LKEGFMPRIVLTANTKATAYIVVCATLMATPQYAVSQHEIEVNSETQECKAVGSVYRFNIIADPKVTIRMRFDQLRKDWQNERGSMSSIDDMSMLIPYQNIIGMGMDALPLLLSQLRAEGDDPDQWFWALLTIAEANDLEPPQIAEEDQGNFLKMAKAWLAWGENLEYAR
jgi:hypothetical protein